MTLAAELRESYLREQPLDAARCLEAMPAERLSGSLDGLSSGVLAGCMDYLSERHASALFAALDAGRQQDVLRDASPRLALVLLDGLDDDAREILLQTLPRAIRDDLVRLQNYDENSAGRLLDRPYDSVRVDMTVAEALQVLRRSGARRTRTVYVVDRSNRLAGRVDMQAMAMAPAEQRLDDLSEPVEASVLATAPRSEVVELLERYRVDSLPVTDVDGRLLGIVRYQTLFAAIEAVATASLQKMVGASADERALSPPSFSVRRRLPWLHINLLTAFLAAAVVGAFESLIAQFTALAVLLPVVAGQSGNAGSQALAVTMRGLALREVGTREWRKVFWKELQVGLIDGLALALTCGAAVFVWSQSLGLAIVIGVAMVLSMIAAGISGAVVPMLLIRFGQDPATASSIILTTVTDVAGFISFLGTATLLSFML